MSDSHGRFKVRRGELEIEYEGPGFIEEYKAALAYLGVVGGAQTRLEDTGFEALPKQAVTHQVASHPPMTLAPLLSGIQGARMESEFEISSFGLEGPGPSSQASENSASQEQEARPSQGLMFIVPGHTNQRPKLETGPQSAEPKKETNPLFENKPRKPEGAVPSGTLNDDKFIAVLKRLGLSA